MYILDALKMGKAMLDQYSLLHAAVGVISYFWGLPLWLTVVGHVLFELLENTQTGMNIINGLRIGGHALWPGGKPFADSAVNSVGDTMATLAGWLLAAWLDDFGQRHGWYVSPNAS